MALHLILLFAGFLAPYDPAAQDRELPYAPPTRLHFRDAAGWHLRPFVYALDRGPDGYVEDTSQPFPVPYFVTSGASYQLLGMFQTDWHLFGVDEPAKIALFGTDGFGRDEFSRVLYGGQISVAAGIVATLIALAGGTHFRHRGGILRRLDRRIVHGRNGVVPFPALALFPAWRAGHFFLSM